MKESMKAEYPDLELVEDSVVLQVLDEEVPQLGVVFCSGHIYLK